MTSNGISYIANALEVATLYSRNSAISFLFFLISFFFVFLLSIDIFSYSALHCMYSTQLTARPSTTSSASAFSPSFPFSSSPLPNRCRVRFSVSVCFVSGKSFFYLPSTLILFLFLYFFTFVLISMLTISRSENRGKKILTHFGALAD